MAVDILGTLNTSGSGLRLRDLSATLAAAETAPKLRAAQTAAAAADLGLSAHGRIRARLDALSAALANGIGGGLLAGSSSSAAVGVAITDPARARAGTTGVEVVATAKRQVMEFGGFTDADQPVGTGSLSVAFGVWFDDADGFAANPDLPGASLDLGPGATLTDLAGALDSLAGVAARVVDKGDGTFSLAVVSDEGAGRALRLTAAEGAQPGLAAFDTTADHRRVEVQAAADAMLIVDGVTVFRPGNVIDDLIPGATLTLNGTTGAAAAVTLGRDADGARDRMTALVDEVNATLSLLDEVAARGVGDESRGALAGNPEVTALRDRIAAALQAPVAMPGRAPVHLADFGVQTTREGLLRLDSARFDRSFKADPEGLETLLASRVASDTPGLRVTGRPPDTTVSGEIAFAVDPATGLATVGGAPAFGRTAPDGTTTWAVIGGPVAGMVLTTDPGVTNATLSIGQSRVAALSSMLADALGFDGALARGEKRLTATMTAAEDRVSSLTARTESLETRYLERFTKMEAAIARMKSTGTYISNLVAAWNKND